MDSLFFDSSSGASTIIDTVFVVLKNTENSIAESGGVFAAIVDMPNALQIVAITVAVNGIVSGLLFLYFNRLLSENRKKEKKEINQIKSNGEFLYGITGAITEWLNNQSVGSKVLNDRLTKLERLIMTEKSKKRKRTSKSELERLKALKRSEKHSMLYSENRKHRDSAYRDLAYASGNADSLELMRERRENKEYSEEELKLYKKYEKILKKRINHRL